MASPSLVVWDFDLTLLRIHAHPGEDVKMSNFYNPAFFVALVQALVASGSQVAIASHNHYSVVLSYVQPLFRHARLPCPFDRSNVSTVTAHSKNAQLADLARRAGVTNPAQVVLFDNDARNVALANAAGYTAVQCVYGFTPTCWTRALGRLP